MCHNVVCKVIMLYNIDYRRLKMKSGEEVPVIHVVLPFKINIHTCNFVEIVVIVLYNSTT